MLLEMNQWHLGYSQLLSDVRTSAAAAAASGEGRTASPQSIAYVVVHVCPWKYILSNTSCVA